MAESTTFEIRRYRRNYLVSVGIALVAAVLLLVVHRWHEETTELIFNVHTQAAMVSTNASAALVFNDPQTGAEMLAALGKSPVVLEAALYRSDGNLLAAYVSPGHQREATFGPVPPALGTRYRLNEILVSESVTDGGREVGRVAIRASQEFAHAELRTYLLSLLGTILMVAIFAYLSAGRLRRRMALARHQVETSRSMLKQLSDRREMVLEAEHRRIAIEIHDQLGQVLTAALLNLRLLERSSGSLDAASRALIRDIESQLDEAYKGMKDIAASLHPAVLQFGLPAAIEWLAERMLKPAGITLTMATGQGSPPLDASQSIALFRIVQEAFANVIRHAKASEVKVFVGSRPDGSFVLEIADQGMGFDAAAKRRSLHFGLLGIRQRAESVGARCVIESSPGKGTRVRVTIENPQPLEQPAKGQA